METAEISAAKIIDCALKVHTTLGNGFKEEIYQRCLAIELSNAGLVFDKEVEQPIYHYTIQMGTRKANFIVDGKIVVEIRALSALEDVHVTQAKNYVIAYEFLTGLLFKFWHSKPAVQ